MIEHIVNTKLMMLCIKYPVIEANKVNIQYIFMSDKETFKESLTECFSTNVASMILDKLKDVMSVLENTYAICKHDSKIYRKNEEYDKQIKAIVDKQMEERKLSLPNTTEEALNFFVANHEEILNGLSMDIINIVYSFVDFKNRKLVQELSKHLNKDLSLEEKEKFIKENSQQGTF